MDQKPLERIWSGIAGFSRRVADGVAHLTTWQFILLCILGLIGAGILESILAPSSRTHHIPRVSVSVDKGSPKTIIKGTGSDEPKQPPADALKDHIKDEILTEIQKDIDSGSDAADTTSQNSKKSKKSV